MPDRVRIEVLRGDDSTATPLEVRNLRVVDEGGSHLLAKAHTEPTRVHDFEEGNPVLMTWGFYGSPAQSLMYVHRVEDASSRFHHEAAFSLTLVGSSWPLKSDRQRVLRRHSASQILHTIAEDHGLAADFSAVNREFSNFVSQTSDWAALRDLAQRSGGMLRVDGTTIRIFDLNDGLSRIAGAPVFSPDTDKITKVSAKAHRSDSRRRVMTMVHPDTKDVITVDDTTEHDDTVLELVARPRYSVESPKRVEQALRAERLSKRFHEQAIIESMVGVPRLRPGEVVGFRGMTKSKNGYWTVTKADHQLDRGNFVTALELGRSAAHPRQALHGMDRLTSPAPPALSGAALRQGRWVAT